MADPINAEIEAIPEWPKSHSGIIDCDVHVYPRNAEEIRRYLTQPWKHRFHIRVNHYYQSPVTPCRTVTPDGGKPGTEPEFLRQQLLQTHDITTVILLPRAEVSANHDPDYATAVAAAYNRWLSDTWLDEYNADGAYKGSIMIAHQDPLAAAKEIDRWAGHPHFVQVVADSGARAPFGQRHYYPIYEACARHGLPLAIHPGADGIGINILASQGYPSHYLEYYASLSFAMQVHLVSMLTEGVFERFPDLKIVITEGGVTWIPALMWRLDQEYKGLRSEVPWVKKLPSEYLRDHVRMTTQPLERPQRNEELLEVLSMMNFEEMLLFSSDYPDEHFASPGQLEFLTPQALNRILLENAKQLYHL
ncbi:amidohydrolase family protein [Paenibacillus piri]|uniref:Amidohydrolase n=1 Tax=Paenibacillus piri TaxID=2547395 RepID=A0A4R5KK47_9BACL|nr:amidohydrolase family protein [Paenibacillus piri]TDF95205.1 amidohydrolase [Paenibacillus piri]